jgi:hypothetical protein
MQFRLGSAFLIFIGSYFPLAIILAVQDIPSDLWEKPICSFAEIFSAKCSILPFQNSAYALFFLAASGISAFLANLLLRSIRYPFEVDIKQVKAIPNEIINYTFPYVVSFMGVSYAEPQKLLGFLVFLLWMFAITFKSGQIIMNPLLLIFGWRLYEASIIINEVPRDVWILKQGPLTPGLQHAQTIQDFYICRD